MQKWKQTISAENDVYRLVPSATLTKVEHVRELFAQFQERPVPPELTNLKSELVELLRCELHALCRGSGGGRPKYQSVSPEFLLGYMDGVVDAAVSPLVEGKEQENGQ